MSVTKKTLGSALMSAIILAAVSGCGSATSNNNAVNSSNGATNGSTASQASGQTLTQVKKSGELKIGTEGTYAPFTYHNAQDQLTGFDVELAQQIAKRLGVKADFVETPWDGMFAGLNDKRFDMIANEVGITPDREKSYLFSNPYIESSSVIIVNDNNNSIHSFKDLKGVTDAQSLTSNYYTEAKNAGANIVPVQGFNEAIQLVKSGRAQATVNDKLSFLQLEKSNPNIGLKIAATANDTSASGFMFRKDRPDLQKAVNKALQSMIQDGTYAKISKKYFGTNVLDK